MSTSKNSQLQIGADAPRLDAVDVQGNPVSLDNYRDKYVLLVFLRYSGCPWCNLTIQRLGLEYPMLLENDCEIIAFVQSRKEDILENVYGRHATRPPFPIVADPDKKIYDLYKVQRSKKAAVKSLKYLPAWTQAVVKHGFRQTKVDGDIFLVPATFLLGKRDKKILKSHYGKSFYEFESFFSIYESLIFKDD